MVRESAQNFVRYYSIKLCMFFEILELFIQFFIVDEIIQIFQIFFCAPVIFYEIKKINLIRHIVILKITGILGMT